MATLYIVFVALAANFLILECKTFKYAAYNNFGNKEYRENLQKNAGGEGACAAGKMQSPIDINENQVQAIFKPLIWRGYSTIPDSMKVQNNGETVKIFPSYNGAVPTISGGRLLHNYRIVEFHFHWGQENSRGSEHAFFSRKFPMEVHAVHLKDGLSLEEAKKVLDGIVVIGYWVMISQFDNPWISPILSSYTSLKNNTELYISQKFPLNWLLLPFFNDYYTYSGSLTTEPYSEAVTWIMSKTLLTISQRQLNIFRIIASTTFNNSSNYREIQQLNGRTVFYAT